MAGGAWPGTVLIRTGSKGKGKPKGFGGQGRSYLEDDWGYANAMPMKGPKGKGKGKQAY